MTFYEVPEDVGVVKVCAIVYSPNGNIECPIEFPFEVFLSTTEGSAAPPMDYAAVFASLIFEECETRRRVNISIEDDMTLENIESFNVILDRLIELDRRIRLDPVIGVIQIIDNDRAVVGLERTFYVSLRVMVQWKCALLSSSLIAVLIVPLHSPSLSTSLPLMIVQ